MTQSIDSSPQAVRRPPIRRVAGIPFGAGGWIVLGVAVVVAVILYAVASRVALRTQSARQSIETQLEELTGLSVTIEGSAGGFTLLPRPRLTLTNIRVGAVDAQSDAVMKIDGIVADLDLWRALTGQADIRRLTLIRPELLSSGGFMTASSPGPSSADARRSAMPLDDRSFLATSKVLGALLSRFGNLKALEIREGVFRMAPGSSSFGISNANLVVSWPAVEAAAEVTGSYVWNGQPTEVDLSLAAPLAFLEGGRSALSFDLAAPPLVVSFKGEGTLDPSSDLSGRLRLQTTSLSRAMRWLGDARLSLPDLGAMAIEADLVSDGRRLDFRNARVTIDGFTGEGAVEMVLSAGGRPTFGGTLAFDQLNLTGVAEAVAPLPDSPLAFQRPISVDFIDHLDLDLRLSATQGQIGSLSVGDLAATLKFKDGVGTLDVGDATLLGGRGQLRAAIDTRVATPVLKGSASLTGVDAARLFAAMNVPGFGVTGLADLDAQVRAPVANWAGLIKGNSSDLRITARDGVLSGFDPALFLTDGTRPFELAGRTAVPFETLQAELTSKGSVIDLQAVEVNSASGAFKASGRLSAATRGVDVSGSFEPLPVTLSPAADPFTASQPIGFTMRGEWPNPNVTTGPLHGPM